MSTATKVYDCIEPEQLKEKLGQAMSTSYIITHD